MRQLRSSTPTISLLFSPTKQHLVSKSIYLSLSPRKGMLYERVARSSMVKLAGQMQFRAIREFNYTYLDHSDGTRWYNQTSANILSNCIPRCDRMLSILKRKTFNYKSFPTFWAKASKAHILEKNGRLLIHIAKNPSNIAISKYIDPFNIQKAPTKANYAVPSRHRLQRNSFHHLFMCRETLALRWIFLVHIHKHSKCRVNDGDFPPLKRIYTGPSRPAKAIWNDDRDKKLGLRYILYTGFI